MKILFSHYYYMLNILSQLAFEFGWKGNLSLHLCLVLNLKGRPLHPNRTTISTPEMKRLVELTTNCFNDIFYFVKVLGL